MSKSGLIPSAVALSLLAALAGCHGDTLAEHREALELTATTSTTPLYIPPRCVRWENRDTTTPLWRTGVESAMVVIGPSTSRTLTRFVAYGVDVARRRVVWVYDIERADKSTFLAIEGREFRAASGFDSEHSHIVIDTVHGPGPTPPQPGEPPGLGTINNVVTAAVQIEDAMEASKAAAYE